MPRGPVEGWPAAAGPELLYRSVRTCVYRVPLSGSVGMTAIRKERRGVDAADRVRREVTVLRRLVGVPGVPDLLEVAQDGISLLLSDSSGTVLSEAMATIGSDPAWAVRVARSLADLVGAVHRHGVIHKDINPSNVLVSGDGSAATLVDFDLASTFAEEHPVFTHHSEVTGTLPYLAPEQTGRTGWPVDHRADLYALGATLYEVLTGRPPFGSDVSDPLQLIHAHLARTPESPSALNPTVPEALSAIVLRLLEKEPDQRYQSADGLAHDLARLAASAERGGGWLPVEGFGLGERDFPLRLTAPSLPVGRDAERAALVAAYQRARTGGVHGLLVSGASGVGKSALLNELRSLVTEHGGWLVTGKFDRYRQDADADAVPQALTALGRLLLAEPEEKLARHRERLLAELGSNAPVVAIWPEFAALLGVEHQLPGGDPAEVQSRMLRAVVDVLRSVATPQRPLVMVLDDLQWAPAFPLAAIDAVLTDGGLSGVLLVGAYRDAEVEATHGLSVMRERWQRLGMAPPLLRLENLPPSGLATMLAEMLRLHQGEATRLAAAIGARTAGNPFDTVELVNALRREGALVPDDTGWGWDADTIRRFVGSTDVIDLLTTRIERLPPETGRLLEIMAYLSGEVETGLLAVAAEVTEDEVRERLQPALEDGLLVPVSTGSAVRFRHDRVQEAAHEHVSHEARDVLHLSLARRLIALPEWAGLAAEQYLHAFDTVELAADPAEARRAAGLFLAAGARLKLINAAVAERYLSAALSLLAASGAPVRDRLACDARTELHESLFILGRLDDAERLFRVIEEASDGPLDLLGPVGLHISSLIGRGRPQEGLTVGLRLLAALGVHLPPPEEMDVQIARGLADLHRWVEQDGFADDLARPEIGDPRWRAVAEVIRDVMAAASFCDPTVRTWLVLRARSIWSELGPCAHLVGSLAHAAQVTIGVEQDYRTGYAAVRRIVAVSAARGWEPVTSQARFLLGVSCQPWFEPLEACAADAQAAREGCLRGGDTYHAAVTSIVELPLALDFLPEVERFQGLVTTGAAFAARTGSTLVTGNLTNLGQLARALKGETSAPGSFNDAGFDEEVFLLRLSQVPVARAHFHARRALTALLFRDSAALDRHARAAFDLVDRVAGAYPIMLAHLTHGMAVAMRLQAESAESAETGGHEAGDRERLLAELDACRAWMTARGATVPVNFGHLAILLDAERAWATGDLWTAAAAFDSAMTDVQQRPRAWQRALISERAALFHLERGLHLTGSRLLTDAYRQYAAWGATGKVRQLDQEYPFLRGAVHQQPGDGREVAAAAARPAGSAGSPTVAGSESGPTARTSVESFDLVGVLRAAQALSTETNLDRLRGRVVEVLTLMTGATSVQLAQWKDDAADWFLPEPRADLSHSGHDLALISVEEAARRGLVPLSVFRYAERTRESLRVDDATRDDRFARDPYLVGLERCSLLLVPIQSHGRTRAMLVLENRLSRGAFSAERLDAVMLIAGQLAVCLDNVLAERFRSLVQRSSELTLVCDRTGVVSYASAAATDLLGLEPATLVGCPVTGVVAAEDRQGLLDWITGAGRAPDGPHAPIVCRLESGDQERWAEVTITDLSADPAVGGLMLRLRDVTERRRLERALEELATTDALTGIANRRRFDEVLRVEVERSLRTGNPLTLVLLDIDHFKAVNDTYGHPVGDLVLKAVAGQCRSTARDIDIVARIGGEEFAVLLVSVGCHEGEQIADRMRKVIEATRVELPGQSPLGCTVSLGVAEFAGDATELMARADVALYRAKAEGRNRVCASG